MDDLISRQAAIDALVKAIREDPYYDSNEAINGLGVCDVRVILNDLPSAERHGQWIDLQCDQCGQVDMSKPNYCPNCGAKMDEVEE